MRTFILYTALIIVGIYPLGEVYAGASRMDELSAKYKHAVSEKERLNICIEAIDLGILSQGSSVQAFDALFGTNWVAELPRAGEPLEKGYVNFAEQPKPGRDDEQTPFVGWYCAIEFDSHGIVHSYYLSNSHK
jgi:hypothetical protein